MTNVRKKAGEHAKSKQDKEALDEHDVAQSHATASSTANSVNESTLDGVVSEVHMRDVGCESFSQNICQFTY